MFGNNARMTLLLEQTAGKFLEGAGNILSNELARQALSGDNWQSRIAPRIGTGTIARDIADLCWVGAIGDSRFQICSDPKSAIANRRYPTKICNILSNRSHQCFQEY